MIQAKPFQQSTISKVENDWSQGARAVLVVSPTGSGKTVMGSLLCTGRRSLWVAHRRELVHQAAKQLRQLFGARAVGIIMPGETPTPSALIQVASTETLLARGADIGRFDLLVLDEAHHYEADTYRAIRQAHPDALCLGLTATPERHDGRPLGDTFERLIVAASYSELIASGDIVAPTIFRPPVDLGSDKAADPVAAWLAFAASGRTFAYYPRLEEAKASLRGWQMAGVRADHLDGETPKAVRDEAVEAFESGKVDLLTNVYVLTEGINVPNAEVILSARKFEFVGAMIQAFGRVLRPSPTKTRAIVIDLCGSTNRHGLPHQDREYSLTGKPIVPKGAMLGGGGGQHKFDSEVVDVPMEMLLPGMLEAVPAQPVEGHAMPKPIATLLRGAKLKKIRAKHGARAARVAQEYWRAAGEE